MAPRARKKAKKSQQGDESSPIWTSLKDMIAAEPRDQNDYDLRRHYGGKLSLSVLEAVQRGDIQLVRQVWRTNATRKNLSFAKHEPRKHHGDATDELCRILGKTAPVQPYFGLREMLWLEAGNSVSRANLLVEAIRARQPEMLRELLRLGEFDVNAIHENKNYALLEAIRSRNGDMIRLLLDQPHIILTHPQTLVYKTCNNGQSRPHCKPTPLVEAAKLGMMDVIQLLIEKGALLPSSTRRKDDPYPMEKRAAQELVDFSIQEALWEAYKMADANPSVSFMHLNRPSVQAYADVLEFLLAKSGGGPSSSRDLHHVVETCVANRIGQNRWSSTFANNAGYELSDDYDFDHTTGAPSARAIAVVRGCRAGVAAVPVPPSVAAAANNGKNSKDTGSDNEDSSLTNKLIERKRHWSEIVQTCRQRLKEAQPDWRHAMEKVRADFNAGVFKFPDEIRKVRSTTQLLLWCDLLGAPFSTDRYSHYDAAAQQHIREIAHVGSALSRQLELRNNNDHGVGTFKHVWDREVLSYVID